jgi:CDP-glycerol glycerophosphotransferase (TagB/SpsB family)
MIINLLKTFHSLIFLNFNIAVLKFFLKKKIFFFYHQKTVLTSIYTLYIEDLFNSVRKDTTVLFGCQPHDKIKLKLGRNYYFIKQGFLKWIFNADVFISVNVCDVFTNNSIKVFMHHDIYDTPLISKKKEKVLLSRLSKYDHIFLSSKQTFTVFAELFKINLNLKKPLLHETGYPRLDYLIKKKKNLKRKKTVIIAPTGFKSFPNLTMQKHISEIISFFIKSKKYEVIYRPHPLNAKEIEVLNIEKKFKNNPYFKLDISNDYFKVYKESNFLISDLSGTAYTYALLTNNPVIFFSRNENYVNKTYYKKLNYFKNRKKIGIIIYKTKQLKSAINKIENNRRRYSNSINNIKKKMTYLGKSKKRINYLLNKLC